MAMNTATETQHTPGPWRAEMHKIGDENRWYIQFDGSFMRNATIAAMNSPCAAYDNAAADARLIAAAPEMLEALEGLLEELRLIRMKDTNAVYNPTIRVRAVSAVCKADRQV